MKKHRSVSNRKIPRVHKRKMEEMCIRDRDIAAAFEEAKKNTKTPTIIEFIIDPEEMVYPMIKPGGTLEDRCV